MFESLKQFTNIVISGPQRSGTRIVAKIVAADTEKLYIDEKDINFHDIRLLQYYLKQGNVVIQCPCLCHLLHYILDESTLIVVVRRSTNEIITSEYRSWSEQSRKIELHKYGYSEGVISRIKYDFWDKVQKPSLGDRGRDINFYNLKDHKLFINDRKNFRWDQTE